MTAVDARVLVEVLDAILAADSSLDALRRAALGAVVLVPSTLVVFGEIEVESGEGAIVMSPEGGLSEEVARRFAGRIAEHPVVAHQAEAASDSVVAVSDLMPVEEFIASDLYQDCYLGTGIVDELRANVPVGDDRTAGLVFCRDTPGFTEEERTNARLTALVVAGCHRHLRNLAALKADPFTKEGLCTQGLTEREAEVFSMLAKGQRSQTVANELGISVRTVEKHTQSVYRRYNVTSRAEAMAVILARSAAA
ncbi:MAG: hypothetical protein F2813_03015 [Actinobacteria bacterium]|uniref:Unannotated protein n=1 Tax=freshwater metagenome TaxID=449393 RepID=A0A6J5ZJA2_9ZZZZ|nr:hypothetical protein [Actinomycetota bacterium]